MSGLEILFVGDEDHRPFRQALESVHVLARVVTAPSIAAAVAPLQTGFAPAVIVVAQKRPGEFSSSQLDQLRRLAPAARLLGLLGSWCEGEPRSGNPWPAVPRIYWHQWPTRGRDEIERLLHGESPLFAAPPTATPAERLIDQTKRPRAKREGVILVDASSRITSEWLLDACRALGYRAIALGREFHHPSEAARLAGIAAALWDGETTDTELLRLETAASMISPAPVLAIVHFPRHETQAKLHAAGAAAVLAKPFELTDLDGRLRSVIDISLRHNWNLAPATA